MTCATCDGKGWRLVPVDAADSNPTAQRVAKCPDCAVARDDLSAHKLWIEQELLPLYVRARAENNRTPQMLAQLDAAAAVWHATNRHHCRKLGVKHPPLADQAHDIRTAHANKGASAADRPKES